MTTFPYAGIEQGSHVWRNHETGVEIIESRAGLHNVTRPTLDVYGRIVIAVAATMDEALKVATAMAGVIRTHIAAAHTEAAAR